VRCGERDSSRPCFTRADELRAIREAVEAGRVKLCAPVPSVEQPREVEERGRRVLVPYVDACGRSCLGEGYQTPKHRVR
jgi:hypothetical protein